jgi:PhnB protein
MEELRMSKPIPEGFHSVTPYVTVKGAAKTIDFLKTAFGARLDHEPIKRPDGSIMHATLKIGESMVMLAEESEQMKAAPATLYLYVPNADVAYQAAIKAGGKSVMEPADQFYGDRSGGVKDPSGNSWFVATHKEDVSGQELQKRAEQFYKQQKNKAA